MHGSSPKTERRTVNRRGILLLTSAVASMPLVAPAAMPAAQENSSRTGAREPQYRETAHIRTYYARARF
jgi:hypothetical protein